MIRISLLLNIAEALNEANYGCRLRKLRETAANGNPVATFALGLELLRSTAYRDEGLKLLYENQSPAALDALEKALLDEPTVRGDYKEFLSARFQEKKTRENAISVKLLVKICEGEVEGDNGYAYEKLLATAMRGDPEAMWNLAIMLPEEGDFYVSLLTSAWESGAYPKAALLLGVHYAKYGDCEKAGKYLAAIEKTSRYAHFLLDEINKNKGGNHYGIISESSD